MRVAVQAARRIKPSRVMVAVPVAPATTVELLRREADLVFCPATPHPFDAVGQFYRDFDQTTDDEVQELLRDAWRTAGAPDRLSGIRRGTG